MQSTNNIRSFCDSFKIAVIEGLNVTNLELISSVDVLNINANRWHHEIYDYLLIMEYDDKLNNWLIYE